MFGRRSLSLMGPVALISMFVIGCLAAGCGDSKPPVLDKKVTKEAGADGPVMPDMPQQLDKYVWPDQKKGDKWPWPTPDQYVPAPFGCQADSDCFGQKCCATPLGVKLCAPTCDLK
jgi:hypothetical protein